MGAEPIVMWSIKEEFLLGAAVLRYGTGDWTVVAMKLKARTDSPCNFTPELCKAKYEELERRYSGYTVTDLVEELRKKRMEELRKDLEQSEEVIGSLESKIKSLMVEKDEKTDDCRVDNGLVGSESQAPLERLDIVESSAKDMSKDGLSAGSFTHETNPELSGSSEQQKVLEVDSAHPVYEGEGGGMKKVRGKRKRKDCDRDNNEASVRENARMRDLMEIVDSVMEVEGAAAFRRKHDSQMRARYRQVIRIHMDFHTIRTRISKKIITSEVELFRDLLLLTNNALVFYSKINRKYKTALILRDHVTKMMNEKRKCTNSSVTLANTSSTSPVHDPSVNIQSMRSANNNMIDAAVAGGSNSATLANTSSTSLEHDPSVRVRSMHSGDHNIVANVAVGSSSVTLANTSSTSLEHDPSVRVRSICSGDHKIAANVAGGSSNVTLANTSSTSLVHDPPVRVRSMRSGDHMIITKISRKTRKPKEVDSPPEV